MKNYLLLIGLFLFSFSHSSWAQNWSGNNTVGDQVTPAGTARIGVTATSPTPSGTGTSTLLLQNSNAGRGYTLDVYTSNYSANDGGDGVNSNYGIRNRMHAKGYLYNYGIYNEVTLDGTAFPLAKHYGIYSVMPKSSNEMYGITSIAKGENSLSLRSVGESQIEGELNFRSTSGSGAIPNMHSGMKVRATGGTYTPGELTFTPMNYSDEMLVGSDFIVSWAGLTKQVTSDNSNAINVLNDGTCSFRVKGSGQVYAREITVTLGAFPDYVFEKDYNLLPLKEVKSFIETNGHLPNIPSAKEIDENAIGLGDLSIKQMEKIEELTLYILQLDERLEKVEKENAELKKLISEQ